MSNETDSEAQVPARPPLSVGLGVVDEKCPACGEPSAAIVDAQGVDRLMCWGCTLKSTGAGNDCQ